MATELKLSEAIRLGAMLKPQAVCIYSAILHATCAIGAAADAVGVLIETEVTSDHVKTGYAVEARWPFLINMAPACPAAGCTDHLFCDGGRMHVRSLVQHLNDDHRWSRERIADHVATIEAQQESSQPISPDPVPVEV